MPALTRFGRTMAGGFIFSMDQTQVVAHLRLLADNIEAGTVALQTATETNSAKHDDFQIIGFALTYAAKFSDPAVE